MNGERPVFIHDMVIREVRLVGKMMSVTAVL
ncbi:hypothetical protein EDC15_12021 [Acetobacter aceti NBRC 14818]|nr:hypothetical protein EDC15_12021 [Acetobacter aceti NBRC 14818]